VGAWTERAEDGRVRYALAGLGLGLLIGSLLSGVGENTGWISGTSVGDAPVVGFVFGLCLFAAAPMLRPRSDRERAWEQPRKAALRDLITKADADPEFREQLMADPRGTFEREFGSAIPDDGEITVLEETPDHAYLVLQPSKLSRRPLDAASCSQTKRAVSKRTWEHLVRAGKRCERAWTDRAEDGRVRYGIAGLGLGLLIGSLLSVAGENIAPLNWTSFGYARLSLLGLVLGLCLFAVALMPESWTEKVWAWKRRRKTIGEYLISKAEIDPEFRKQLIAEPRRAFERVVGSPIADDAEITVLEETPDHAYLVLKPSKLSREQLNASSSGQTQPKGTVSQDTDPYDRTGTTPDGCRKPTKSPARRVIYGSREARIARLALGILFALVTGWIVAPVLSPDHAPPPPVGLAFLTDAREEIVDNKHEESPTTVSMAVRASGCVNPVTIEGQLERPSSTWKAEKSHSPYNAPPEWAALGVTGAHVRAITVGIIDPKTERMIVGTHQVLAPFSKKVVVHAHLYQAVEHGDTTSVAYHAPEWPLVRSALGFVIVADLIHPTGFHSCYLDLPDLFQQPPLGSNVAHAGTAAGEALDRTVPISTQRMAAKLGQPVGIYDYIGAFQITASVNGRVVDPSTIGERGRVFGAGALYQCYVENRLYRPPVPLDPLAAATFAGQSTPSCAPVPLFQPVDAISETTRRLFIAGILGAIAATLIIEAGFLGETEPAPGSASSPTRRRRWGKGEQAP